MQPERQPGEALVHELKTHPGPFTAVVSGQKHHEVRRSDRDFQVGDLLHLREWEPRADHPDGGFYTGRSASRSVSHITQGGEWGLPPYLCVMSLETVEPVVHACSLEFPEVVSESIDNLCGALGVMAEQLEGDLERINCPACLRMIAEAGERRCQEACGSALEAGRLAGEVARIADPVNGSAAEVLLEVVRLTRRPAMVALAEQALAHQRRLSGLLARAAVGDLPIPMVLRCPSCLAPHIDEGEWATKPHRTHRTHLCLKCQTRWRPANVATVGVEFLPEDEHLEVAGG